MGSFGNRIGAVNGGEFWDSETGGSPLVDQNGHLVQLSSGWPQTVTNQSPYQPDPSGLLGQVPNSASDSSTFEQVMQDVNARQPGGANWESWAFSALRSEMQALSPAQLNALATAWKSDGDNLQTASKAFQSSVRNAISEKWSGVSADAAAAATQQVTKTSIYDFTPSSEQLANRLTVLSDAFSTIIEGFPGDGNDQLIDGGNFNQAGLAATAAAFNSTYHLDGSGHLRNNSNGYVATADAINWMNQIKLSIKDYHQAVHLFRDIYNPTVEAVTNSFPNLPSPPDMTFGQVPAGGGGGGGGSAIGGGGGGGGGIGHVPGIGGGGGGIPPLSTPNMPSNAQLAALTTPNAGQSPTALNSPAGSTSSTAPNSPAGSTSPTAASASPLSSLLNPSSLAALDGPLQSIASPLQSVLGQMMNAGKGTGPLAGASSAGNLPKEGAVRGLGSGGGKAAGGAGIGAGAGASIGKPPSAPGIAAGGAADRAVPASYRAGLSGAPGSAAAGAGAGAPGAGAPGAGNHGANAQGNPHQPSKVLRRKKNGEELIGDTEAVVPVLGAPTHEEDAQPDAPVDPQRDWTFPAPQQRPKKAPNPMHPMQSSP